MKATGTSGVGIGNGYNAKGGTIRINGGVVTATGSSSSSGIGNGTNGSGCRVCLSWTDETDSITANKYSGTVTAEKEFLIDGNVVDLKQRADGVYYLAMDTGVWANHMQDAHSYTISDGTNTFIATASVLTYAKACAASDSEVNSDLGKALYRYCMAVTAVFPNN